MLVRFTGFTVSGLGRRSSSFFGFFNISLIDFCSRECVVFFLVVSVYSGVLFWFKIGLLFQFYDPCGLMFSVYSGVIPFRWFYCSVLFGVVVSVYLIYCFG